MPDEHWDSFGKRVNALTDEWLRDPSAFADNHPHIPITIVMGGDRVASIMRSIAAAIGGNRNYHVLEIFGARPMLMQM